ncbi:TonB-dependent siderophore receptor [Lacisediminimonas sp.]|uniref:TonB-dependent receptor plug domain-containing protein n=1 Tax=Lacisediminimonas sp. TaxID=3060582 RepID=UPI00271D9338|nr:TonB-dependent receptor [Lacisediminimonas sp.]MDO8301350.1 TonB-dependent receptor [Lacisediminimonas sp.]
MPVHKPIMAHDHCQESPLRRMVAAGGLLASLLGCSSAMATEHGPEVDELVRMPIEQLLDAEVYSASKYLQSASDAPSAVSVVTSEEIRSFGWRTLADILRTLPGLTVNQDRNYTYLGARGFLRPGDYNTRFLLLIDGQRTNDAVYNQAAVGTEFMLDIDLIERVEYVPGAGSSMYGANAFFGVINVVTKNPRNLPPVQLSGEAGRFGGAKGRATLSLRNDAGAELLLSATRYRSTGADLYYPEFDTPGNNNGIARGLDHDLANSLFAKGSAGPWRFTLAHAERTKGIPTASFAQVFNDPRSLTRDVQTRGQVGYRDVLSSNTELSLNLSFGRYQYEGDYVYDVPPLNIQRDGSVGSTIAADIKLVSTRFSGHKLVFGAEHSVDHRRAQYNYYVAPYVAGLDDRRRGRSTGLFIQDEIMLGPKLVLNAGLRLDSSEITTSILNPRLALIYKPRTGTVIKGIFGTAYRDPNAYEMYYQAPAPDGQNANPRLKSERIQSRELIVEQRLGQNSKLSATLYQNIVSDLITQSYDPGTQMSTFLNAGRAVARGLELALDHAWAGGARLRASTTIQHTHDGTASGHPVNSPRVLGKANISVPLGRLRTGFEAQYVGPRSSLAGQIDGYWVANATLLSASLAKGVELSASLYNVFNRRYADPGGSEHTQDSLQQDPRTWRMKLTIGF